LTFLSSKCLAGKRASRRSRKVFRIYFVTDIVSMLHPEHNVEGYNADRIGSILRSLDGVHVLYGRQRIVRLRYADSDVMVRVRSDCSDVIEGDEFLSFNEEEGLFELRYMCATGLDANHRWTAEAYCRHGGRFKGWWRQKRGEEPVQVVNVCNDVLQHWDLCVYVRRKGVDVTHFRDEYLKHMGGQSQVVCAEHGFPVTIHSLWMISVVFLGMMNMVCDVIAEEFIAAL